ncbi:alpha-2-macroglobulin family protein [Sediminicola sp. 1XM1-17]|uniref:alpha-2-macroglobulin family protein n=1 Tax=Sediminicola sp. 1XM1-17 TaxID=3127702 RepID=UPI003077A517
MKNLVLLLVVLISCVMGTAQQTGENSYEALWKKVAQLENESLTTSALELVRTISQKAEKEKNSTQTIKALLYSSKYIMILEEDSQLTIVNEFNREIAKASPPTKNILESYLANLFWQYFQQNRYTYYNRTRTLEKVDPVDFRTWDLNTLFAEINLHFERSLENPEALQSMEISLFAAILHHQKGSHQYRPTLYDVLAHTALDFYKSSENSITSPAYRFELDQPEYLSTGEKFSTLQLSAKDSSSLQLKALKLYQQLLMSHQKDNSLLPYIDVDIERLHFVRQNGTFDGVDQHYLTSLKNAAKSLDNDLAGLYKYEIAALYDQWANNYLPESNVEHQWKRKEALDICNTIMEKYPESPAADKCSYLKTQILSKSLQLRAEEHIPINLPSRILVHYKNRDSLHLTAYRISSEQKAQLEKAYPIEKQLAFIKELHAGKQWKATLKNVGDHLLHGTEILLPPLPNGHYAILAVNDSSYAFQTLQVTNIAVIETKGPNEQKYQVVNRINGFPVSKAQITVSHQRNYDGQVQKQSFLTDKQGFINIPLTNERWTNVSLEINTGDERAYFGSYFISQDSDEGLPTETNYFTSIFTDRSIYRPGQTVFFKGIAMERNNLTTALLKNTKAIAVLLDANNQEIGRQEYKTNDYGSFQGQFILPSNGLTGEYSIRISSDKLNLSGYSNFSVEEYKRPKFETSLDQVTESYKVNDSIAIQGNATAFAGSPVTNAKVSYSVRRIVQYPEWYYWSRPHISGTSQEIAHGETMTDEAGKYEVNFKALPDVSIPEQDLPIFSYEITADVTDINGETHSTTTVVRVGYHSLMANINMPNTLDKDKDDHSFEITTTNLNGQKISAMGTIKIYKLKGPKSVLRERPWPAPEFSAFEKEEFQRLFPHDSYAKEENPESWEKGALVWQSAFDTATLDKFYLGKINFWVSGRYAIVIESEDKFGREVKVIKHATLFSNKDKRLADNQLFDIRTNKETYAVGEAVKLTLATNAAKLKVTLFIEKDNKVTKTIVLPLSRNTKTLTIPTGEGDLGGFTIGYSFSAFNGFVHGNKSIVLPYPDNNLKMETITFRDKLAPGAEETWSFRFKGAEGDKVTAEVLAGMYDASLDTFRNHQWNFDPKAQQTYYSTYYTNANQSFGTAYFNTRIDQMESPDYSPQGYDTFNWFDFYFGTGNRLYRNQMMIKNSGPIVVEAMYDTQELAEEVIAPPTPASSSKTNGEMDHSATGKESAPQPVQIRKNLQETAFFFPHLKTDKEGNVSFSFKTPEALTSWKLQVLAHTSALESTVKTFKTVTQKELMVTPNVPRFLREGDTITISSKISNLTEDILKGEATIMVRDALSGKDITQDILSIPTAEMMSENKKDFEIASMNNTQVSWSLAIPKNIQAVELTVMAKAGDFSDGEQNTLPVLTNRMLVTETLPMWVHKNQTKTFTLDKLKETTSTTRSNHKLTLEITSNPTWYAIQALPYLMEYPYDCNEQIFGRLYANTLANHITKSNPNIEAVFNQWARTGALESNLEKNQDLKSILIQETPWLRDAQTETEQKKRIALLFNQGHMQQEQQMALHKLTNNQMSSGAWAWFPGGPANRFITQHILAGIGHLKNLDAAPIGEKVSLLQEKGLGYLDEAFVTEYKEAMKHKDYKNNDHLSSMQIHYLYVRSFYGDQPISTIAEGAMNYYLDQASKYWPRKSLYEKALLALVFQRKGMVSEAQKIVRSLKENSISSDELGMYWKENTSSWHWQHSPIETQALLIEAFTEVGATDANNKQDINLLKTWLLKNKQTNHWPTTKATTDAIYAILLGGREWLSITDAVTVKVGGNNIGPWHIDHPKKRDTPIEAGSGYYKTTWNGSEINSQMADVQLGNQGEGIAWGALYWQYFEDLDKISPAKTPLQLEKKLFLKKNTDYGEELKELTGDTQVKVGDLVRVHVVVRADRTMEYIHLKDMRAAGLEPVNTISHYKWQDGLGYYESTKDASTNFFFDTLPKGIYVFEYDLRVNNPGDFSNGITTIQSMYAPEFSSHSKGNRIHVMEK